MIITLDQLRFIYEIQLTPIGYINYQISHQLSNISTEYLKNYILLLNQLFK